MPTIDLFGQLPDGCEVHSIHLASETLTAEVLTWGAVIRDLRYKGHAHPLVLGLNTLGDYLGHSPNFGATLGRCANRIAGGRFSVGRDVYELERNETGGKNCIHGGSTGTSRSLWEIIDHATDSVTLRIKDPDGNAGFPGEVSVICYVKLDAGTLSIRYESCSTQETPVNIAHHGYFNLGGGPDICDHVVRIAADSCLQTDANKIPMAPPVDVNGTAFDFRMGTMIGPRIRRGGGFDHNYCLSSERQSLRPVAWLDAPNGLSMEVATTEPGLQLFTADNLNCPVPGLEGRRYGANAGICFETQIWPDAVNQPGFPEVLLHPGQARIQETQYRFRPTGGETG